MSFFASRKGTILIPSGPAHDVTRFHLHVILNDPYIFKDSAIEQCLMVSLCTIPSNAYFDPTCTISAGDHPFVTHNSYIAYHHLAFRPVDKLIKGVAAGLLVEHEHLLNPVFERVSNGVFNSRQTAQKYKLLYQEYLTSGQA